jgi:hypothetical protein
MKYATALFGLAIVLASIAVASAESMDKSRYYTDGNKLHKFCTDASSKSWLCGGYIMGVADTLLQDDRICVADTVTTQQIVDIAANFLSTNPEMRHLPATVMVRTALQRAYLCERK